MSKPAQCRPPDPAPRPPKAIVPAGACDCHFHIFDGPSEQVSNRSYSASKAGAVDYRAVQNALRLDRGVIVQPSIYGFDNRTTLDAVGTDGTRRAVVVVPPDIRVSALADLKAQGAVGVRVNVLFSGGADLDDIATISNWIAELGMHLQMLADISKIKDLESFVTGLPVPVVFDHFGHVSTVPRASDPAFKALLHLVETGKTWVKLSAPYRLSQNAPGYPDIAPLARALIAANPERMIWGSDWPHPAFNGPMPNDGSLLDLLYEWADEDTARQILVRNPETLYGFPKWDADYEQ